MHQPLGLTGPSTTLHVPCAPGFAPGSNCVQVSQRWPSFGWSWYFIASLLAFACAKAERASHGAAARPAATFFSQMIRYAAAYKTSPGTLTPS